MYSGKGINWALPADDLGTTLPCLATILIECQPKMIAVMMGNTYFQNTGLNAMAAAETGFLLLAGFQKGKV